MMNVGYILYYPIDGNLDGLIRGTPAEMRKLRADFRKEAKQERLVFKESLGQEGP